MAVHERRYRPYSGPWTPTWSRFLVLPRFALRDVFAGRGFLALFVASFVPTLVALAFIYLRHNANALAILQLPLDKLAAVDATYFLVFLRIQIWFALLQVFMVAPGLVSADFRNNALPLLLGRPFSRTEYVLGKLTVLVGLMSVVTWVPGLLLVGFQGWVEPGWLAANGWIAGALFAGSWVAILGVSLPALAISAWVKWKPLAAAALVAVAIVPAVIGETINGLFGTWRGSLLSIVEILMSIWSGLFRQPAGVELPLGSAWTALVVILVLCLLTFWRRIRAYEVAR